MKLDVSKEWCMAAAEREGDSEVGAGTPPQWFIDVWAAFEAERAQEAPNRLLGAYINEDGDAV